MRTIFRFGLIPLWALMAATGMDFACPRQALASEQLTGIAARSVHLYYHTQPASAALVRMKIEQSTGGSYFMACGWHEGYFGVQELPNGRKVALFSVWDSAEDNPQKTPDDQRVQTLYRHPDARMNRFGGEGSGGHIMYPLDWKIGDTLQLLVAAWPCGDRTAYAGYIQPAGTNAWIHLVTFSKPTPKHDLRDVHSFVEDFLRNRASVGVPRRASFGPVWTRGMDGAWQEVRTATFTADQNRSDRIDAGIANGAFYLATGGDTSNTGVPVWHLVEQTESHSLPENLPDLQPPPPFANPAVPPPAPAAEKK